MRVYLPYSLGKSVCIFTQRVHWCNLVGANLNIVWGYHSLELGIGIKKKGGIFKNTPDLSFGTSEIIIPLRLVELKLESK